jgi:hypothetical protein
LICESAQEFVEKAVRYGRDRRSLEPLRERLRAGRDTSTLFDMPGLVHELEGLYDQMWQAQQTGMLPRPKLENLEVYLEVGTSHALEAVETQALADYHALWLDRLARRHLHRPIAADSRLISPAVLAAWG